MFSLLVSYVLDTCVLSNLVKVDRESRGSLYPELWANVTTILERGARPFVSHVTLMEIERGFARRPDQGGAQRNRLRRYIDLCSQLPIEPDHGASGAVWQRAGEWHGRLQALQATPAAKDLSVPSIEDLLIASSAQAHGLLLLTTDGRLVTGLAAIQQAHAVQLLPVR